MGKLVNQPTSAPTRKVASVGVVAIVVPVIILVAGLFGWEISETELTNTIAAGITFVTGVVALVTSYRTRNRK